MFQTDTEEDTILIWNLWGSEGYCAWWVIREFSDKNWKWTGIKILSKKGAQNRFIWSSYRKWQTTHIPQLCGAVWSSRWLMVQLTNGQHTCELVFKPKADILNITLWLSVCFLCTWWTLCFTPRLMQQVLLRQHYKSMKCDVLFSQGSVRTLFSWGGLFYAWVKKCLPLYKSAKIIKIDQDFPKLWSQMYCHLFYGSQCRVAFCRWDF